MRADAAGIVLVVVADLSFVEAACRVEDEADRVVAALGAGLVGLDTNDVHVVEFWLHVVSHQ